MSWTFLLTASVICLVPGTGALYTVGAALTRGVRAGLLAAAAGTLGVLPHMVAALTGLAALLHASGVAFAVVKYAGVAYLLWMAWSTWRDTGVLAVQEDAPAGPLRVLWTGITLNLLNPKLTIFFVAFMPQFVPADAPHALLRLTALSGVFLVLTFLTFVGYAVLAATVRDRVLTRPHVLTWLRRTFAATFALLAGRLALEPR